MEEEACFVCPYCGEQNFIDIDISAGSKQQFIQDCEVCCRPIEVIVMINADGNVSVDVRNDEGFGSIVYNLK